MILNGFISEIADACLHCLHLKLELYCSKATNLKSFKLIEFPRYPFEIKEDQNGKLWLPLLYAVANLSKTSKIPHRYLRKMSLRKRARMRGFRHLLGQ